MIKDEILFSHQYNRITDLCLSCKENDHHLKRCPLITYQPDKNFIILKLNYSKPQKRQTFQRRYHNYHTLTEKKNTFKTALSLRFDKDIMNTYKISVNFLTPDIEMNDSKISGDENSLDNIEETKSYNKFYSFNPAKTLKKLETSLKRSKTMNSGTYESIYLFPYSAGLKPSPSQLELKEINNEHKNSISAENMLNMQEPKPMELKSSELIKKQYQTTHTMRSFEMTGESLESPGILKRKSIKERKKPSELFVLDPKRSSLLSPMMISEKRKKNEERMKSNLSEERIPKSASFRKREGEKSEKTFRTKTRHKSYKNDINGSRETFSDNETFKLRKKEKKHFYWYEFERMRIFKNYFTHNNVVNIVENLARKKLTKKTTTLKSKMTIGTKGKNRSTNLKMTLLTSPNKANTIYGNHNKEIDL